MLSIVYVSAATTPMTDDDVAAILVQARANNQRADMTGALLYNSGRFIQIIEGPDEQLRAQYAKIVADPRHNNVQMISEKRIARRQFPEWTMGFSPLSNDSVKQLEGFDNFFAGRTGRERLKYADSEAHQLLEWLAEYWFPRPVG